MLSLLMMQPIHWYKRGFVRKTFKIIKLFVLVSLNYLGGSTAVVAQQAEELCIEGKADCTFVLLSSKVNKNVSHATILGQKTQSSSTQESETLTMINRGRAKQQYSPFSTFKVPNSLIGLDTHIIKDTKQPLYFSKENYPVQKWWPSVWKQPSYNLHSAFKFSMVAIYRQLATDIGQKNMQEYVSNFSYGNEDISSGLDNFWLGGSMKISAIEQVKFLQKMLQNQLTVNPQNIVTLKEVMLVESTDDYKLYAKTGAGRANGADKKDKSMLGWYIGFVERIDGVHYFAFNFTRESYAKMKASRVAIARNHLKQAGIIK
jgi:beta-lactamase class D